MVDVELEVSGDFELDFELEDVVVDDLECEVDDELDVVDVDV